MTKADRSATLILAFTTLYFCGMLADHFWPAIGQSMFFFFYLMSMPLVLAGLAVLAISGTILWIRGRAANSTAASWRSLLIVSIGGLLTFGFAVAVSNLVAGGLPTGSRVSRFDRATWLDGRAAQYVDGDITPRQKMLADVVENKLPGKTRKEVEQLLGASLDTPYFKETGRDLIYVTGPERDTTFAIDSEWLLIWLDERGRFKRYQIATD